MELTQIRQLPAVREVPMKSASADSKRFFTSRMFRKQRNTVCIFRFWNCTNRVKSTVQPKGIDSEFPQFLYSSFT